MAAKKKKKKSTRRKRTRKKRTSRASARTRSSDQVSFMRGGQTVRLHNARNLFTACFRDGIPAENVAARFAGGGAGPNRVRFVRRIPGRQVCLFHVSGGPAARDEAMKQLRSRKEEVIYCSHALRRTEDDDLPGGEVGVDDTIFVDFGGTPSPGAVAELQRKYGVRRIWSFPERTGGAVFQLTSEAKENPIKIANKMLSTRAVPVAEPCLIEPKVARAVPSDPGFTQQWHLLNTGQGGGKAGADCNATEAWDHTWGDPDVTISLIDDGFDLEHPDLGGVDKLRDPYDASQRDVDPSPADFGENHGTACAGVAIAKRGSGISVGIAPDCSWMPIRHAGELGDFNEALAFYHAYRNGADVISCSWGPWDAYENKFWPMPSLTRWVIDLCRSYGRGGRGIPVLFAAGNGNEPVALDGYASYDGVIAVGASTNQDNRASYSDYGENVWVCAPSNGGTLGIFTTDRRGYAGYSWYADYTDDFGGTSSATPLVAGVIGLMLSVNHELTEGQIRNILRDTAAKIRRSGTRTFTDTWGNRFSERYKDGHSLVYGWGRVDAGHAVRQAKALLS